MDNCQGMLFLLFMLFFFCRNQLSVPLKFFSGELRVLILFLKCAWKKAGTAATETSDP